MPRMTAKGLPSLNRLEKPAPSTGRSLTRGGKSSSQGGRHENAERMSLCHQYHWRSRLAFLTRLWLARKRHLLSRTHNPFENGFLVRVYVCVVDTLASRRCHMVAMLSPGGKTLSSHGKKRL